MIGAKSIVFNFKIKNNKNVKSPYEVKVQANKNYGFCDIILPKIPMEVERTFINTQKEDKKKVKKLYDVKKSEYDKELLKRKTIRNKIFNSFQGKQLNDVVTISNLKNALHNLLNEVSL